MEASPNVHLSADDLRAFGLGMLDDPALTEIVGYHLENCPNCRKVVTELSGDDFLNRLRQACGPNSTPAPAKALAQPVAGPRPKESQTTIPNLPPGLAGNSHYEVLRELGRGGMGIVYLARNTGMGRLEVIKIVNPKFLDDPATQQRFRREIRSAAQLQHANIVTAYAVLESDHLLGLAMEYVEGENLEQVVAAHCQ